MFSGGNLRGVEIIYIHQKPYFAVLTKPLIYNMKCEARLYKMQIFHMWNATMLRCHFAIVSQPSDEIILILVIEVHVRGASMDHFKFLVSLATQNEIGKYLAIFK